MRHFSHKHSLVLQKAKEIKTDHSYSYDCDGCDEPISGPFYSCKKGCRYFLHKVCAELPETMNHPMHPQHPLTLLVVAESPYKSGGFICGMCNELEYKKRFIYKCSYRLCSFYLHTDCAIASHTVEDKCHMHPLIPIQLPLFISCNICLTEEKGVSYKCSICPFWVHQNCTVIPTFVECTHHDHQLTLLTSISNTIEVGEKVKFPLLCNICEYEMTLVNIVYCCVGCFFFAHASCATIQPTSTIQPSSLEIEMDHFSHEHRLVRKKAKEIKFSQETLLTSICDGCREPISGPFYRCKKGCDYRLHKVCAELPKTMNHPMHPQHPLTLLEKTNPCSMCTGYFKFVGRYVYNCSICSFNLDMVCAASSHTIEDKCHMHPLTPVQLPTSFRCLICRKKEEGLSYKCSICPFWVHQNCTLLPSSVECNDHEHELTLLPSIPIELHEFFYWKFLCDICHDKMTAYETVYSCVGCMFFSHASCTTSSKNQASRDKKNVIDLKTKHLPIRKDWTSLIALIVGNDEEEENICEECEEFISDCKCCTKLHEQISNLNKIIECEIDHFSHKHVLHLLDGQLNDKVYGKVCEACAEPISAPSYGCTQCDYFLHKCCIDLPKQISHALTPWKLTPRGKHDMKLFAQYANQLGMFHCTNCSQWCNTFGYKCVYEKCGFVIDLKCATLLSGLVKHEAHKHTLCSDRIRYEDTCSACGFQLCASELKCETCNFGLCCFCAMLPAIVNHRSCKCDGFKLQYFPVKDYHNDYYCDLCEKDLQPKRWFYHCGHCDQFAHTACLIENAGDSNIKFGKCYNLPEHKHELILAPFTYEYSNCKICITSLNKGFAVGFECATCPFFKIHLECVEPLSTMKSHEKFNWLRNERLEEAALGISSVY